MGHNLDLCKLLGAPGEVECPKCGNKGMSYFDDYDVECGNPNPEPGVWKLDCYCSECSYDWFVEFRVKLEREKKGEEHD